MRIRKNRKLTPSIIWSTAASPSSPNPPEELLQPHICVVNRSPWDRPPSPPPPPSLYLYPQAIEAGNDSYGLNCNDVLPADKSTDSMKISSKSTPNIIPNRKDDSGGVAVDPPRKRKPGRPRKVPVAQAASPAAVQRSVPQSDPGFYYYSGFGPRWGKRRGGDECDDQKQQKNVKSDDSKDNNIGSGRSCSSSSCSPCLIEEPDSADEDDGGRKRMRKPVKARSLNSIIMSPPSFLH